MLKQFVVVVGDVHAAIPLAVEGLNRLELELGAPISQTFSVGDLGLFFTPEDWAFLTGPKKYRFPEQSEKIAEAWAIWRWPLAAIAGNHWPEPPDGVVDLIERPERELVTDLRPDWVCCGHHHTPARFKSGESECIALNIIGADRSRRILPGWAAVFTWDGERLNYARSWPDE
jgi:hypothetical protein